MNSSETAVIEGADANTCEEALPVLLSGVRALGLHLHDSQTGQLEAYCRLLYETSARMNLTALRSPIQIVRGLILESLALEKHLPPGLNERGESVQVIDVGSGGGVPGIPLKILHPEWTMLLVESTRKKAAFLTDAVSALGLQRTSVVNQRAEEVGWDPLRRDRGHLCVARAVAPLSSLLEFCAPLVRPGGFLLFPKGRSAPDEVEAANGAATALHARLLSATRRDDGEGYVVLYHKESRTPPGYPRRIGLPRTKPIRGSDET